MKLLRSARLADFRILAARNASRDFTSLKHRQSSSAISTRSKKCVDNLLPRFTSWPYPQYGMTLTLPHNRGFSCNKHSEGFHANFDPQSTACSFGEDEANRKIKELLNNRRVVLFMKGSPDSPMCGFSAKAVSILKKTSEEDYTFVNVLEYPLIREGIKRHSNWPTIPQLFVNGQLVGGCDILIDLYEKGELQAILAQRSDSTATE